MAEQRITDLFELQSRLIYSLIVAGKSADFANNALERWYSGRQSGELPLDFAKRLISEDKLEDSLRKARTGNYGKLVRAISLLTQADLNLQTCQPEDLEKIPGFGPKTSRFFILWTRPDANFAALDVHILRWLRAQGYDAPKTTPQSGKKYAELEQCFLKEARNRRKTPRELDFEIWEAASTALNLIPKSASI